MALDVHFGRRLSEREERRPEATLDVRPEEAAGMLRVAESEASHGLEPGVVLPDHSIACGEGALALRSIQPAGGKAMSVEAFARGRKFEPGMRLLPVEAGTG